MRRTSNARKQCKRIIKGMVPEAVNGKSTCNMPLLPDGTCPQHGNKTS